MKIKCEYFEFNGSEKEFLFIKEQIPELFNIHWEVEEIEENKKQEYYG